MADFYGKMKAARMSRYKVLQSTLVKPTDRERAAAIAAFVTSGEEAFKLQGYEGFAYQGLDMRGRAGVIRYKGIEVALLFKREVVELEPGPADPAPEFTIKDPAEAWIQINLLDTEAHVQQRGIAARLRAAMSSVERFKLLWEDAKSLNSKSQEELDKYKDERAELQKLPAKVEFLQKEITQKDLEIERLNMKLRESVASRTTDKISLVRELFPVFNTLWLAGIHRVEDTLYGSVKNLMVKGLNQIGVELIEPQLGEEFNPELHHAIHSVQFEKGAKEIGTVVQTYKVGLRLGGRILDAAEVLVGVEKEEANAPTAETGTGNPANVGTHEGNI